MMVLLCLRHPWSCWSPVLMAGQGGEICYTLDCINLAPGHYSSNNLHLTVQACVSQKTRKLLGPEDFSGLFSGEFPGFRKAFLNAPENTPDSHPSFSGCFLGFAARAWQWFVKNLNWHSCTELGSSRTLKIKPSFFDSFVESQANFWLFLSFVQFQRRLLYFDWSLSRM